MSKSSESVARFLKVRRDERLKRSALIKAIMSIGIKRDKATKLAVRVLKVTK